MQNSQNYLIKHAYHPIILLSSAVSYQSEMLSLLGISKNKLGKRTRVWMLGIESTLCRLSEYKHWGRQLVKQLWKSTVICVAMTTGTCWITSRWAAWSARATYKTRRLERLSLRIMLSGIRTHGPSSGSRVSAGWVPSLHTTHSSTCTHGPTSGFRVSTGWVPPLPYNSQLDLHPRVHRVSTIPPYTTYSSTCTHGPTSGSRVSVGWVSSLHTTHSWPPPASLNSGSRVSMGWVQPTAWPTPLGLLQLPGCQQGEFYCSMQLTVRHAPTDLLQVPGCQ